MDRRWPSTTLEPTSSPFATPSLPRSRGRRTSFPKVLRESPEVSTQWRGDSGLTLSPFCLAAPSLYPTFEELLAHPEIEAVVIATPTSLHAPMCIQALRAGKHVLLEKPISIDIESSLPVLAEAKLHPELKVMIAFSRRFDESNKDAYSRLQALGNAFMVKSATNDK